MEINSVFKEFGVYGRNSEKQTKDDVSKLTRKLKESFTEEITF